VIKEVQYPKHLFMGIRPLKGGHTRPENIRVFGLDTETRKGHPLTLQVEGPEGPDDALFIYTNKDRILTDLWCYIRPRLRPKGVNIFYVHNLNFDLRVLFANYHLIMYEQFGDIKFQVTIGADLIDISMIFGKVNKAELKCGSLRAQIFDSKAFTQAPFAKSLKMFGVPAEKFKEPEGLGDIDFSTLPHNHPDRIAFESYARQDPHGARLLGEKIMSFHKEYDVRPSISLPSFAARVFRRQFLALNEEIPFPPMDVVKAAELSYHGGKNGFYSLGAKIYEDLYEFDISSAYPYAMSLLPGLTKGEYWKVSEYTPNYVGLYCITGYVRKDGLFKSYPIVYTHDFKPIRGAFENIWITSYELAEILARPYEVKIESYWGYVWIPAEGAINPFARFVDRFYSLKQSTPKTDPNYHFYKIILNALYGKLVSTIEVQSLEQDTEMTDLRKAGFDIPSRVRLDARFDPVLGKLIRINRHWRAGALYNPFIASLITGHTRAYLYRLETSTFANHSATDAVKTSRRIESVDGLGGLKMETYGRCYIFRNKLYLHFCKDPSICGHKEPPYKYPQKYLDGRPHPRAGEPMLDLDGQHLCKVGMHGYKGPIWQLFENRHKLIQEGFMEYQYRHVVGLREGMKRKLQPCNFLTVDEVLDLRTFDDSDLLSYIINKGGINYHTGGYEGELSYFTFKECHIKGVVRRLGGRSLPDLAEAAWSDGYLQENDQDELLSKLHLAISGKKIYADAQEYAQYEPDAEENPQAVINEGGE
jgi:hypothetical protein